MTATAAPGGGTLAAGEVLARYLSTQATELLRGLRDLPAQEAGAVPAAAAVAGAVHGAAFRIADTLGTFGPLLDPEWAERLEGELYWLGTTVLREHVYAARRDRLVTALRRLSGEEDTADLAAGAVDRGRAVDAAARGAAGGGADTGKAAEGSAPASPGAGDPAGTARAAVAVPGARPGSGGGAAPAGGGVPRGGPGDLDRETVTGDAGTAATAAARRPGGALASAARGGPSRDGAGRHASETSPSAGSASGVSASAAGDPSSAGSASRASGSSGSGSGWTAADGGRRTGVATTAVPAAGAPRSVGAARAGALLERRLGLARSRAHSEALDALTSARYHALADAVALLVSDAPFTGAARRPAAALPEHHDDLRRVLAVAVAALPLARAGRPYNAAALARGLAAPRAPAADDRDDAPWRHVHALVRRARHAAEILAACPPGTVPVRTGGPPLPAAGAALDRDREAVEAAAAAAAAAATPRIAPATAYALGVLHADQRHEVEAARFTFGRLWQTRGEQE
ncbi:hypothetical protein DMB38_14335 [Streptomyces sp. WAC 06738]|uniref:hypothetical protein n=1 Tax=Streptomyces sp. WAC 06738 TaxID=2203210 RepID=UPI000F6F2619|nr:hypothetical protein [Streptomyces sp. WAC 06738]AZM46826.1 hypothetical protein DMB38_14335 [Streptomyces sp. WAC 06738]